ncbi:hypothetical protein Taro_000269 [Colocasia esculenta]|uniref:Retrotransposon gag domain-containing protein n=1 Tax=Colocasia esculenta TaxID=4460 RepID=A0A843TH22_COLES|nr:hypothetical protein [Colocasia esculenta]
MWCVPLCLHGLWFGIPCEASARSREADSDQVRYRFNGLDRGDPPQKFLKWLIGEIGVVVEMIRRKAPSAPVPPVAVPPGDGEAVPVAPVPPRVEVPFVANVPPPVLLAEEPVLQVKKFLRLQPPTYSGGPNPDTVEHWVHEIERVFATMRCPAADRVVLAAYQLRGFALEWWRLKMQTTFAGRTEEAITWLEFLDLENPQGRIRVSAGFMAGELGVNIACRQDSQPGECGGKLWLAKEASGGCEQLCEVVVLCVKDAAGSMAEP